MGERREGAVQCAQRRTLIAVDDLRWGWEKRKKHPTHTRVGPRNPQRRGGKTGGEPAMKKQPKGSHPKMDFKVPGGQPYYLRTVERCNTNRYQKGNSVGEKVCQKNHRNKRFPSSLGRNRNSKQGTPKPKPKTEKTPMKKKSVSKPSGQSYKIIITSSPLSFTERTLTHKLSRPKIYKSMRSGKTVGYSDCFFPTLFPPFCWHFPCLTLLFEIFSSRAANKRGLEIGSFLHELPGYWVILDP